MSKVKKLTSLHCLSLLAGCSGRQSHWGNTFHLCKFCCPADRCNDLGEKVEAEINMTAPGVYHVWMHSGLWFRKATTKLNNLFFIFTISCFSFSEDFMHNFNDYHTLCWLFFTNTGWRGQQTVGEYILKIHYHMVFSSYCVVLKFWIWTSFSLSEADRSDVVHRQTLQLLRRQ